ncbi:hypothetical protein E2P81_ATG06374 [Venturia nashicola]|uniref:Uncharacterized protein n=1 Tax=Venturia nashicola TaxID=86259 RepID=A0A4Z1NV60_9PEZI|nr:hypothetical protein E6O75_ATG06528 [Venturia nashicola]TLD28028.1 hypothetical protein E2P81_ATG06374 [Venturia nashicola]
MGSFQSSLLSVGSTPQCRTRHRLSTRSTELDEEIAVHRETLRQLQQRRDQQDEEIAAQRRQLEEMGEGRERRLAALQTVMEESWRGIIVFRQLMVGVPDEELGAIIGDAFELICEVAECEGHVFHEVACRVLREHEVWIAEGGLLREDC